MKTFRLRLLVVASTFLASCVGTETPQGSDTGDPDTGNPDALALADAGVPADTGNPETRAPADAGAPADAATASDMSSVDAQETSGDADATPRAEVSPVADATPDEPQTEVVDCAPIPEEPLNLLFIGNSYTAANNLAGLVTSLSESMGESVTTTVRAPGGFTLGAQPKAHAESPETLDLIASAPWDVVVIQEQSQMPTIPSFYQFHTKTGGQKLADAVAAHSPCARIVLFMTWGRRDGGAQCIGVCSEDYEDFDAMQDVLTARYVDLANTLQAELAPVGEAWRRVRTTHPDIELFSGDGSHPNVAGSYLAASVFYATLFAQTPVGATEDAGLGAETAKTLQEAAAFVVLTDPESWLP